MHMTYVLAKSSVLVYRWAENSLQDYLEVIFSVSLPEIFPLGIFSKFNLTTGLNIPPIIIGTVFCDFPLYVSIFFNKT